MFVSRQRALLTSDAFLKQQQGISLNLRGHFGTEKPLHCLLTYEFFYLLSKISSNQFIIYLTVGETWSNQCKNISLGTQS